jgi:voltage-gated potassium channel
LKTPAPGVDPGKALTDCIAAGELLMASNTEDPKELKDTGYEIFILLLSLVSILNMAVAADLYFFPTDPLTLGVLAIVDSFLTIFFLIDFTYRITTSSSKSAYFFRGMGWADLLACIPFFRIFRLFRVVRAYRLMKKVGVQTMLNEVINNRAGIALYITMFSLIVLVEVASVYVLKAEAANPDANLTSAADAVWWVFVTVTTVGYGDRFPTTGWGRLLGILVMFGGIALIGVLASFLSSFFLAPPKKAEEVEPPMDSPQARIADLRKSLEEQARLNENLRRQLAAIERSIVQPTGSPQARKPSSRRKPTRRS